MPRFWDDLYNCVRLSTRNVIWTLGGGGGGGGALGTFLGEKSWKIFNIFKSSIQNIQNSAFL